MYYYKITLNMYGHHRGNKSTCESEAELITLIKVMELKMLKLSSTSNVQSTFGKCENCKE